MRNSKVKMVKCKWNKESASPSAYTTQPVGKARKKYVFSSRMVEWAHATKPTVVFNTTNDRNIITSVWREFFKCLLRFVKCSNVGMLCIESSPYAHTRTHTNSINLSGFGKSEWNNLDVLIANNCFDLIMPYISEGKWEWNWWRMLLNIHPKWLFDAFQWWQLRILAQITLFDFIKLLLIWVYSGIYLHRFVRKNGKLALLLKSEIEIYNCGNMLIQTMGKKESGKRKTVVVNNTIEEPNRLIQFPVFMVQCTSSTVLTGKEAREVCHVKVRKGETEIEGDND